MQAIYTATRNVQNRLMRVLEALLNRLVIEVAFALAYAGIIGWAGIGLVTTLLDRVIEWLRQDCADFGSMSA